MPNPQGNKFRVNLWLEYARVFHLAAYHEHDSCTKTRLAANQELGTGHVTFRLCHFACVEVGQATSKPTWHINIRAT
jgi:hypothetical protein